jgi:hypothetical protein
MFHPMLFGCSAYGSKGGISNSINVHGISQSSKFILERRLLLLNKNNVI